MLNLFWGIFLENFCPVHAGGSKLGKRSEKWKNFHFSSKSPNTFPKKVQKRFEHALRYFFLVNSKKKIDKNLKFQKCPKTILKVSKQVLKLFWGNFFWKKSPSAPWSVETWKNSKKLEKISIFQNALKTFPKAIKHVWNMLRGIFAGEKFRPVHPGGSRSRKTSKNWKTFNFQNAQIRSQKCSNLFSTCFEVIFPVKKFA